MVNSGETDPKHSLSSTGSLLPSGMSSSRFFSVVEEKREVADIQTGHQLWSKLCIQAGCTYKASSRMGGPCCWWILLITRTRRSKGRSRTKEVSLSISSSSSVPFVFACRRGRVDNQGNGIKSPRRTSSFFPNSNTRPRHYFGVRTINIPNYRYCTYPTDFE
jgi:hypothetical protein